MIGLKVDKIYIGTIPVRVVHPIVDEKKAVVLYHGWSSQGEYQLSKAYLLAVAGYTVFLPDAANHGEREALADYYAVSDYPIFWRTIFQNIEEFPAIASYIAEQGFGKPFIMGHSMGGMSVLGIAVAYPRKVRAVVSFNGSGDWLLTHLFIQARFGVSVGKTWDLYDEVEAKSPINHVAEIKDIPIFMTNGEADISIDPRAQTHFAEELEKAGGHGTRITYPLLGHFVTTNMMDDAMKWMEMQ